jgi:hypothetical protein
MHKVFLSYLKYKFYARGRHGTHSPFVYHFVEQVLRSKRKVIDSSQHNYLKGKQKALLYRTISYFPADTLIFIPTGICTEIEELIPGNYNIKALEITSHNFSVLSPHHSFLLVLPHHMLDELDLFFLQQLKINYQLLVIHPYKNLNGWEKLKNSKAISISIFYWHFGLLIRNDAFKCKQHFILH